MDLRTNSITTVGDDHPIKRRRIMEGVALTVTAVAVWFSDSYVDKVPSEDHVLLRRHIYCRLFYGSEANC